MTFTTSITKDLLTNPKINFLAARKVGYLIPAGIIVLGAISMSTIGLNNGIDFTGGRNYVIRFAQDVKTDEVRNLLDAQLDGSVSVIQIGTPDQVRVSTNYKIEDNDPAIDQEIEINCLKVSSHCFRKERLWLSSRISISRAHRR